MDLSVLFAVVVCFISTLTDHAAGLYSTWNTNWDVGYESTQCYPIPPNMTLCQNVGYNRMFLPNFLQHEDVKEAIHQSNIWVALVNTNCHPDLKRFLCSLYAPVCVKGHPGRKIPPCFRLCEEVKKSCLPRMMYFGFKWPPIVQCDQFPESNMCIPPTEVNDMAAVKCPPCEQTTTYESIASSFCLADIVMKAKVRTVETQGSGVQLKLGGRKRFFKERGLSAQEKDRLQLSIPCPCPLVSSSPTGKGRYLVMGSNKGGGHVQVSFIIKWQRNDPTFRKAIRKIRKKKEKICDRSTLKLNQNNGGNNQARRPRDRLGRKKRKRRGKGKNRQRKDGKRRKRGKNKKKKRKNRKKNRQQKVKIPQANLNPNYYPPNYRYSS